MIIDKENQAISSQNSTKQNTYLSNHAKKDYNQKGFVAFNKNDGKVNQNNQTFKNGDNLQQDAISKQNAQVRADKQAVSRPLQNLSVNLINSQQQQVSNVTSTLRNKSNAIFEKLSKNVSKRQQRVGSTNVSSINLNQPCPQQVIKTNSTLTSMVNGKRKNSINEEYKYHKINEGEYYKIGSILEKPDQEMQSSNQGSNYFQHLENVIKLFSKDQKNQSFIDQDQFIKSQKNYTNSLTGKKACDFDNTQNNQFAQTQAFQNQFSQKKDKLLIFRQYKKEKLQSGEHHDTNVNNIQMSLLKKEVLDLAFAQQLYGKHESKSKINQGVNVQSQGFQPIMGHQITKEYRTKMMDWMIEVCSSFKCTQRTYFLATQFFDKYLLNASHKDISLENKNVHAVGITSMYIASKYEDIYPLHSKIVSDKIAHKAFSSSEILKKETDFLNLFDYQLDLVTHIEFFQTYTDKIQRKLSKDTFELNIGNKKLKDILFEMGLVLIKMAIQNIDYCKYSMSIIVVSSIYAATAFLKHSKKYEGDETSKFCAQVRQIIFSIVEMELTQQNQIFQTSEFLQQLEKKSGNHNQAQKILQIYQNQFSKQIIEQVAISLVDFFKIFDEWHCGLNQLKKFNKIPIEE